MSEVWKSVEAMSGTAQTGCDLIHNITRALNLNVYDLMNHLLLCKHTF